MFLGIGDWSAELLVKTSAEFPFCSWKSLSPSTGTITTCPGLSYFLRVLLPSFFQFLLVHFSYFCFLLVLRTSFFFWFLLVRSGFSCFFVFHLLRVTIWFVWMTNENSKQKQTATSPLDLRLVFFPSPKYHSVFVASVFFFFSSLWFSFTWPTKRSWTGSQEVDRLATWQLSNPHQPGHKE